MYNPNLIAFIEAANLGSFTKAGKKLFISSTAVIKQINSLENSLGLKLFSRTKNGVTLTEDGKIIYKEANYIVNYSNNVVSNLKNKEAESYLIRIGTSFLCSYKPIMDIWNDLNTKLSKFKIKIVPFDDDNSNILNTLGNLGKDFDIMLSACDSKSWLSLCNFYKLRIL